ncbi:MAG: ABC transporter permease [Bacteroidia bacterium]|nr:ABC transporter permease [Bacteroidia bacterium]MDW8134045.1 ABC transporter permease [Bacteroidia bacterium]
MSRWAWGGIGIALILIGVSYFFPINTSCILCAPSWEGSWMGTDAVGRDIALRLLRGWGVSMGVAQLAAFVSLCVGTVIGLIAGSGSERVDTLITVLLQAIWVVPVLLWSAMLAFIVGNSLLKVILAIGLSTWVETARLVRIEVRRLWRLAFVEASKVMGYPKSYILWREILPNLTPLLRTQFLQVFATAVLIEAGLGFVGIGIKEASLGVMLFEATQWITLPQGQIQGIAAAFLLTGTVFALYLATGNGRNAF